jgi:hypothetical protein
VEIVIGKIEVHAEPPPRPAAPAAPAGLARLPSLSDYLSRLGAPRSGR